MQMHDGIRPRLACAAGVVASFAALLAMGTLAGCGEHGAAKASQVAVKVNKDEITVLQVNEQLAHAAAGLAPDQVDPVRRRILDGLVNQQLLVEQALERKLDRDPEVLGAIEAARLNILAQAYVQRVIAPQAKPGEQEIKKYYAENPALFADRKVFRLQELLIEVPADLEKDLESAAARAGSLKQLADYLHAKKLPFSADSGVRTAEQLPMGHLTQIAALTPGKILVFPTGNNRSSAIEVLATESQPLDDKKAAVSIEQFLQNRKREELSASELKRLRESAKIEYVGDYAKLASEASPLHATAAGSPAPAADAGSEQNKGIAALH